MTSYNSLININPEYTTNNIDNQRAGLYQVSPNTSNLIVRVNTTSDKLDLKGEICLNTVSTPKFQGYNGTDWLDFNATQGPTGPKGDNFVNVVNFNNLPNSDASPSSVSLGSIFATSSINASTPSNDVNIRSIKSGINVVNSNLSINSMTLSQNSNIIVLQTNPLPYKWDFTGDYKTINKIKNLSGDTVNFSWGETSSWVAGANILKGQAVIITTNTGSSNIIIKPLIYTSLSGISPFTTPYTNMLGIATQSVSSGSTCVVCTKGITTALCTNDATTDFTISTSISAVGIDGIVGKDGGIFCNTNPSPSVNYIKAGYFLEYGSSIATSGNYILFYVNPQYK